MAGNRGTRLLVAGVLTLAAVAAFDAVRDMEDGTATPPVAPTASQRGGAAAQALREAGVSGRWIYADEDCTLHGIALPGLEPTARPLVAPETGCAFAVSPSGQRALAAGSTWSPDGRLLARCGAGTTRVTVASERGAQIRSLRGCDPAWTPDGLLTVIDRGEIVTGRRTVLSRAALYDAARLHPNVPDSPQFIAKVDPVSHAWLSTTRLAVLLSIRVATGVPGEGVHVLVAFFERGRATATQPAVGARPPLTLSASPNGAFVEVSGLVFRSDGRRLALGPPRGHVRAVAFSPDERWVARAVDDAVDVFATGEGAPAGPAARVDLRVRHLVWR